MKQASFLVVSTSCDKLLPFAIAVLFSLSGVFLLLSVAINVISLIVCYCKRKNEHNDDECNNIDLFFA